MNDLVDHLDELIAEGAGRLEHAHELALSAFTNSVARRMSEQGISQADLARRLGVSRARVSHLLQHKSSPTLRTMVEVANALGCDIVPAVTPHEATPTRLAAVPRR
jgi:transcriptional regulator with XRE-family HTH domain